MMKLLFVLLVLPLVLVSSKNSYFVTVPKKIRAGSVANIYVNILRRRVGRTVITATLTTLKNVTLSSVTGDVSSTRAGNVKVLKLRVPSNAKPTFNYKIQVSGSGGVSFEKTALRVRLTTKATSLFIQTDRPVYKPGDKVRFRALGTFPNLKAIKDPLDIVIYDPKRNRIKQFLGVQPSFGVFGGDLQLSSLTTHGRWRIEVKQLRETISKSFQVKEYVLPKFEVNIILPSVQLTTDKYFKFKVTAMYTFGKPVLGQVRVRLGYKRVRRHRTITKRFKIKGKADIRILMREVQPRLGNYFPIFATVTETITGNKANDSGTARIYSFPVKMQFSRNQPRIFKPGFVYQYILHVTKQDNSPLEPPTGKVNITVNYYVYKHKKTSQQKENMVQEKRRSRSRCPSRPSSKLKILYTKLEAIPKDGILSDEILFPKEAVRGTIIAKYKKTSTYLYVQAAGSATNNFIEVRIKDGTKAQPGMPLPLLIKGTERISVCQYKIFSKGSLVEKGKFNKCLTSNNHKNKKVKITTAMAPVATLLVYYVRHDGEIVADAISIPIEEIFENKVEIRYDKNQVLPAEKLQLEITADAGSLVCVLAVDKSVLLIRTGNDITVENVLYELQRYSTSFLFPIARRSHSIRLSSITGFSSRRRIFAPKDAFAVFDSAGVYVLTDANLYQYFGTRGSVFARRSSAAGAPELRKIGDDGGGLAEVARTRTKFPETWLWENVTTGNNGTAAIPATAPDTITEWITSAFAVNPRTGLGVAAKLANVTTFQKFFVRLELPAVAIRGEILLLQCTIFNYMSRGLQVLVKLDKSDGFDFSDNDGNAFTPNGDGWKKNVFVEKDGITAVIFPVILTKVGKIKTKVSARSTIIADAVERELVVKADGIEQNYNAAFLIDLRQTRKFNTDTEIKFPPNAIKDSEFIKVAIMGDLMASTLNKLEKLVRQSSGCGEQNMLGFSVNVFASAYLRVTKRITDKLDARIKTSLELGYQRQLTYMRNDGSFSAFGKDDKIGSTWLTAYVVKSFAKAVNFTLIDSNIMDRSISFLIRQQLRSGEFVERGIVSHKAMQKSVYFYVKSCACQTSDADRESFLTNIIQYTMRGCEVNVHQAKANLYKGGSSSSQKSLTAFVLIALLESRTNEEISDKRMDRVNKAIDLSIRYISDGAPASLKNLYELVIVLYALTLANHFSVPAILKVMEEKAVIKGNEKYWTIPNTEAQIIKPWRGWRPPFSNARALDIEVTSYALLIYNLRGETLNGFHVLKWLEKQRNYNGGFISTQDTVVALQALAGLAETLYSPNFDLKVSVKGDQWKGKTFDVNNKNSLVLQSEDVPNTVRKLSIDASGTGFCVLQATVYYNVPKELREPAFDLNVTVLNDSTKGFTLRICFRWLRTDECTMGYLEVYEPTGMQAVLSSLKTDEAGGLFKKIERDFRKVNLYFDQITQERMCIELDMSRTALVARHMSVPVELSEYYESSNTEKTLYRSKALSEATIIEVCGPDMCDEVKK